MSFKDKHVLIVGLGISNVAVAKYLADKKLASMTITDLKPEAELREAVTEIRKNFSQAKFVLGKHKEKDFLNADLIIRNPSVPIHAPLLKRAIEAGILVETDISLFFKLSPSKNIIGVTGTKGKTTTATFLAKMLEDRGLDTVLAGNMGIPVMGKLNEVGPESWVVLELSSVMVESLDRHKISPKIAVYTNLFPDHLNQYKTFETYKNSKKGLFRHQKKADITLLNKDDKDLSEFVPEIPSRRIFYGSNALPKNIKLKLSGKHYRTNLAAAFALAKELGLDLQKLKKTAEEFSGVEHRMEHLGIINGIEFINNSAATNPGAFLADAQTLVRKNRPIFLLCGGSDKNLDLSLMAGFINRTSKIRGLALFKGEGTNRLVKMLKPRKILGIYNNMPEAFEKVTSKIGKGGLVFLNPGCASFGVFNNEFDRGNQFKEQVSKLKATAKA